MNSNDFKWKLLLRKMRRKKTVLLLGPEVVVSNSNRPSSLKTVLQGYIKKDLAEILSKENLEKVEYYSEDGFFFLEDDYRSEVIDSVIQFYEEQEANDLYKKIAQLPFHLMISLSPDKLLCKAFEDQNLPYHFYSYSKRSYNKEEENKKLNFKPSLENRLIYNLFGSTDEEDSLILSYEDLFEFIQRILNNYDLPQNVALALEEANYFIFIGFNYRTWYLKLLLRLINMHQKIKKVVGVNPSRKTETKAFFINEFDMKFTQLSTKKFIDTLHEKCQQENLLVQSDLISPKDRKDSIKKRTKELLIEGSAQEAIEFLIEKLTENDSIYDEIVQQSFMLNSIMSDNQKGLLLGDNYRQSYNRISDAILEILNKF